MLLHHQHLQNELEPSVKITNVLLLTKQILSSLSLLKDLALHTVNIVGSMMNQL